MQLLGRLIEEEHYTKGEVIFKAGEQADAMYYVCSGRATAFFPDGSVVSIFKYFFTIIFKEQLYS